MRYARGVSDEPRLPRPDVAQLYARVREIDETLVLAAEDQDTELIRWYLSRSWAVGLR